MKQRTERKAFMNYGRWIMTCGKCGIGLIADERGVVCPVCNPNIRAKAYQQISNGLLRPVSDMELINQTRIDAEANGEMYFPIYPEERNEIEQILRLRPKRENMNWDDTETVDDLLEQNREHGDPTPPVRKKGRK